MAGRGGKPLSRRISTSDEPWPEVDVDKLPEDKRTQFLARRRAVEAYLGGDVTVSEIHRETGVWPKTIQRMLARCRTMHPDGRVWGYRALVGYQRVQAYRRTAGIDPQAITTTNGTGLAGAFTQLLERYPELNDFIDATYLKRRRRGKHGLHETRIKGRELHQKFLAECRRLGIHEDQYPFTQRDKARRSLRAYVHGLRERRMEDAVRARGSKEAARLLEDTGVGASPARPVRPFQVVEFDAHRLDMHMTVKIPTPYGPKFELINRVWLLVFLELYSRSPLGYYVSLNPEVNQHDVSRCLLNALVPPPMAPAVIEGLSSPSQGRVPNDLWPELYWTSWDELRLDNAMAHKANSVRQVLCRRSGQIVHQSRPRMATARPYVERFFGLLEERVFHRIPGTSGSSPSDPRGAHGAELAKRYHITVDEIRQLVDIAFAEYLHTEQPGLFGHSPMAALRNYFDANPDALLRKLPPDAQEPGVILSFEVKTTIHGDPMKGRRPYVNFLYERYSSDILARAPGLIGAEVYLVINPDDLRVVRALLPDGGDLGYLVARGSWSRFPHSIEMRRVIHRLLGDGTLEIPDGQESVPAFLRHMARQAEHSRRAASQWAQAAAIAPDLVPSYEMPTGAAGAESERDTAEGTNGGQEQLQRVIHAIIEDD